MLGLSISGRRWVSEPSFAVAVLLATMLACPAPGHSLAPQRTRGPCAVVATACTEWIDLSPHERVQAYRTYPLQTRDTRIRRALIVIHGAQRNADHFFATATGAAFLAGALNDTLIVAPSFRSADAPCNDPLAPEEVSWDCGGWRSGSGAAANPNLTSFDFMDALLKRLSDRSLFPNLREIVIAGHSAGAQFVTRYEMANRVDGTLGVPVAYVVANPSSYAWPDASRPQSGGDGSPGAAAAGWKDGQAHTGFTYGTFDAATAPGYDKWPYGLRSRGDGYAARLSDEQLKSQLVGRSTTYLLSQLDTLPYPAFDDSPDAMAQGATRRQRGEAFVNYLVGQLGAKARVVIVPNCGHNDRCVFTSDAALAVLFPPMP